MWEMSYSVRVAVPTCIHRDTVLQVVGPPGAMHDLTGFQRDQLSVVAGLDAPHGLAIEDELDDYYETETTKGRLYPNLDALVEKGLLEKGQKGTIRTATR